MGRLPNHGIDLSILFIISISSSVMRIRALMLVTFDVELTTYQLSAILDERPTVSSRKCEMVNGVQGCMAWGGQGLCKVSFGPAMPESSTPCGPVTPETGACCHAIFYPFGPPHAV
jgi:hypothetical protein